MRNKEKCERKNFEGCLKMCTKAGEEGGNCAIACSTAVKNLCKRKTKLSLRSKNMKTELETDDSKKEWIFKYIF